jgi:hypothetical protein
MILPDKKFFSSFDKIKNIFADTAQIPLTAITHINLIQLSI